MRKLIVPAIFLAAVLVAALWWRSAHHQPAPAREIARAASNRVPVWNTTAQVRMQVATLGFGDRVDVLQTEPGGVEVRTPGGATGWVDPDDLISQGLWEQSTALGVQASRMLVQASGRTRVPANLHLAPGRKEPTVEQLTRDVPVQMLERRAVAAPAAKTTAAAPANSRPSAPSTEEWWLVRAEVKDLGPAAGWTLGRFIALDAPPPLPEYSAAANMHLVAWFVLNRVADDNGGEKPQYLAAGLRPGEGVDYDFSLLRVYTWGNRQQRYETAYVEDKLRGKLPIRVTPATSVGGDSEFRFTNAGLDGDREFVYQMKQTRVRRVQGAPDRKMGKRADQKLKQRGARVKPATTHRKTHAKSHARSHATKEPRPA